MSNFTYWYIPKKFLRKILYRFNKLNPLDTENTPVNSIQADNLGLVEYIQEAITESIITIPASPGSGETTLTNYDAGEGFWVYGEAGVTVTRTAVGEYSLDVPEDTHVISINKRLTDQDTETNGSGSTIVTTNFNTTDFHTSWTDAKLPLISFVASNGEQYFPNATGSAQPLGITATHSEPGAGINTLTLTNVSGAIEPDQITLKLTY